MTQKMADEPEAVESAEAPKPDKKAEKKAAKEAKKAAKKEKKKKKKGEDVFDDEEKETVGGKIAVFLVTILIIVIWLAILALLIRADVGGFGSQIMRPLIGNIPVLKEILPPETDEEGNVLSEEDLQYRYASVDEAVEVIKQLELELAEAQEGNKTDEAYVAELEAEVAKLRVYEEQQAEFEKEKQKFYEEVVFSDNAPDIKEYISYYESIDPVNAEALYREAVRQEALSQEMKDYVAKYSNMAPKNAAAIFDSMTNDLALVAEILNNMDNQSAADILAKMSAENAAKVTEILHPNQ